MTKPVTLCIVGAGSSYTPELIAGLIEQTRHGLPVRSIRLADINPQRLSIMAGLAGRMLRHGDCGVELTSGGDLEAMLAGCDFVITQIRVGGMAARHLDESIPLKHGLIGQETTGPGGMFKALRTIPHMIEIARAVERACPRAFILNYTNPSGVIAEAVTRHSGARILGLCSGMPFIQQHLEERLRGAWPDVKTYCIGLNHFGFVSRFVAGGRDITPEAIAWLAADIRAGRTQPIAQPELIELLQAVPIGYVGYYFRRAKALAAAKAAGTTRAQQIEKLERELFAEAADPACVDKPAALKHRGGGGYSDVTVAVMRAILDDAGSEITVNVPSGGCLAGVEPQAVVEVTCRVGRDGATPAVRGEIPRAYRGVMQAIKAYETLTVEAAVTRSRRLAVLAMLNHPLAGDLDAIEPLVDEMLAAHGLEFT